MTWPRPTAHELERLYDDSYYQDRGMGADAANAWHERADEFLGLLPSGVRSVLDWGAGLGHFVAALRRRGIDAEGFEPSSMARRLARDVHGLDLLREVPERSFDAVTLYHSLEHVENPGGVLRVLRRCLEPRGTLFVEVPHAGSADMILPSKRRQILNLPHHLYHFTPGSLRRLLATAAYDVAEPVLINSCLIEWLLARRPSRVTAHPPSAARGCSDLTGRASSEKPPLWIKRTWRRTILPGLRAALPGWRFQVLARPAIPDANAPREGRSERGRD